MEIFCRKATGTCPEITFDPFRNYFEIKGISRPENVSLFYDPLLEWLDIYVKDPNKKTTIILNFISINTASIKMLLLLLKKCKEIEDTSNAIDIIWKYQSDDDGMLEAGKLLCEMSKIKFEYQKV
ncbi:MAG: SiaC family regulatory phosphoprotein [bacterium]